MSNDRYNGYANYETWAVCLWIDNDQGVQEEWATQAAQCAEMVRDGEGNDYITDPKRRAVDMLADLMKAESEEGAEQFIGNQASVFTDLMNAALGRVDWYEVAESRFDDDETFDLADETEETE